MIGHIMLPEYSRRYNPGVSDGEIMPASLDAGLLNGLLRKQLGFNGLIITDATTMAGFTLPMSRRKAVPYSIACGCDMFLFARNLEEDVQFMMDGVKDGIITKERLDEAVTRILATKAALGLHKPVQAGQPGQIDLGKAKAIVGRGQHVDWAKECADKSITLVKEEPGVLPITPAKYGRILFHAIESVGGVSQYYVNEACGAVAQKLRDEGFIVDIFQPSDGMEGKTPKTTDTTEVYDLILYVANLATKSNQTIVRIEWAQPMGANCGHYINDVPTVFVSLENPYHLLDFPRVRTYINCYSNNKSSIDALIEKLLGRSEFKGTSPVDPFCGKWDARL
jgi:beta-N-acetylhexosaminidase